MTVYCEGIGYYSSQCQIQRAFSTLPPGQAALGAVLLILVCLAIFAVVNSLRDR